MRQGDTDLNSFDESVDRKIKISSSYVITPLNEISSRRFYYRNAAAAYAYSAIKSTSEEMKKENLRKWSGHDKESCVQY